MSAASPSEVAQEVTMGRGYFLLEGAFDPAPVLAEVGETVDRHKKEGGGTVSGGYRPDIAGTGLREMMVDPFLLEVGRGVLRDEPAFGSFGCNVVPPGSEGMPLHLDYPYFAMKKLPGRAVPGLCLQIIWYLSDVGEDDAPTVVVPDTHRRPRHPLTARTRARSLRAKAGSVLISHGALWHGVAPHRGSEDRPVLLGSYVPFWVQPMLMPYPDFRLSDAMKSLLRHDMGYRIGRAYGANSAK